MLARIRFVGDYRDKSNILSSKQLKNLEDFLGEKLKTTQVIKDKKGELDEFSSYSQTLDLEVTDKELVFETDYRKISSDENYIVNLEKFLIEFPRLKISIQGKPKSVDTDYNDVLDSINVIKNKMENIIEKFDKQIEFNETVNVHVPNLGLMNVNRLAYATDYCTEQLQNLLDKGWRIISICPQPDQRRPDYILGMTVVGENESVDVRHFAGDGGRAKEEV